MLTGAAGCVETRKGKMSRQYLRHRWNKSGKIKKIGLEKNITTAE
jgi:hypothetical protein